MRKWVVAGLVLVAVGVGAYLFSQPGKGSIQYHKREYLRAREASGGWIARKAPLGIGTLFWRHQYRRQLHHIDALKELGYLETRVFVVSNWPPEILAKVVEGIHARTNLRNFTFIMDHDTNTLTVVCPVEEAEVCHQIILEADAPGK